jgi:hypothetical protein
LSRNGNYRVFFEKFLGGVCPSFLTKGRFGSWMKNDDDTRRMSFYSSKVEPNHEEAPTNMDENSFIRE